MPKDSPTNLKFCYNFEEKKNVRKNLVNYENKKHLADHSGANEAINQEYNC